MVTQANSALTGEEIKALLLDAVGVVAGHLAARSRDAALGYGKKFAADWPFESPVDKNELKMQMSVFYDGYLAALQGR